MNDELTNLLAETEAALARRHKTWDDVKWVGTPHIVIPTEVFKAVAAKCNYDSGFGAQVVVADLVIVGDNWYFERHEYDGAESWQFKQIPKKPLGVYPGDSPRLTGKWGSMEFEEANDPENLTDDDEDDQEDAE